MKEVVNEYYVSMSDWLNRKIGDICHRYNECSYITIIGANITGIEHFNKPSEFRPATPEEICAFKSGIGNVKDISKSLQKNEESYPFDKLAEGDVVECIRDFTIDKDMYIGKQFIVQRDSNQKRLCIIDRRGSKYVANLNSINFKIISKANSVNQAEANIVEQFQIW